MALDTPTLLCVVGARPNFMKIAPICSAFARHAKSIRLVLVHTGQHYDSTMKEAFFEQLRIPEPDVDLGVGSGTHATQTAHIMLKFEPVVDNINPRAVLVVGDVNSTIACGLVAVKKNIPLIHVEAGLRSNDRLMPEEINRVLTDQISDTLFVTERSAIQNLRHEGIADDKIHLVGNVMIDSLMAHVDQALDPNDTISHHITESQIDLRSRSYAVLTLHRPSNVDSPDVLANLMNAVLGVSKRIPVVFAIHPRTRKVLESPDLKHYMTDPGIICIPPVGYLEMLGLVKSARFVMTDSGGLQEETTSLGIPCITLRENTERPITVEQGTNTLVGSDYEAIMNTANDVIENGGKAGKLPELWDGKASDRIVEIVQKRYFVA